MFVFGQNWAPRYTGHANAWQCGQGVCTGAPWGQEDFLKETSKKTGGVGCYTVQQSLRMCVCMCTCMQLHSPMHVCVKARGGIWMFSSNASPLYYFKAESLTEPGAVLDRLAA